MSTWCMYVCFSNHSVEDLLLFGDECPVLWLGLDQASTDGWLRCTCSVAEKQSQIIHPPPPCLAVGVMCLRWQHNAHNGETTPFRYFLLVMRSLILLSDLSSMNHSPPKIPVFESIGSLSHSQSIPTDPGH